MVLKLVGKRIILRPFDESDAASILEQLKNGVVGRNMSNVPYPYTINDAKKFIAHSKKSGINKADYHFCIESEGKLVGAVSLSKVDLKNRHAVLGYWLGRPYWRKGIMSEAVFLILKFAFEKLKLNRIEAKTMAPNIASARLLEKLGFKKEGILRKAVFKKGGFLDYFVFGLLKSEFKRS